MKLIDKSALVAEIERRIKSANNNVNIGAIESLIISKTLNGFKSFIDTIEVKEVNEVPATVMVNKYGNRFISSWSGLKEYDDFKEGEEIKILIPKK